MNAYELADRLIKLDCYREYIIDSVMMLRQQADRIAELEGEVSHLKHINKNWSISEGLALQRIAELEKESANLEQSLKNALIFIDNHKQTKPLSDEEIKAIANNLTCTPDKNWNVLFAKAILRKAQEK
jgi:hypothetical protein